MPETRSGRRQALTNGFGVPAFDLQRVQEQDGKTKAGFTWTPPEGAKIVHCAVFACRPTVTRMTIENYDSCVVAKEIIEPASGVFDITNPSLEYRPPTPARSSGCLAAGVRRISELAVGCWAFDTTEIIAATPLEQITARGMFNYQGAFSQACDASSEGKACLLGEDDHLGACYLAECRELCVDQLDCAPSENVVGEDTGDASDDGAADRADAADATADAGGVNASHPVRPALCTKIDSYIGYCVPQVDAGQR